MLLGPHATSVLSPLQSVATCCQPRQTSWPQDESEAGEMYSAPSMEGMEPGMGRRLKQVGGRAGGHGLRMYPGQPLPLQHDSALAPRALQLRVGMAMVQ